MLKTQEFRTKDFIMRRAHCIEHQKCKYCVGGIPIAIYLHFIVMSTVFSVPISLMKVSLRLRMSSSSVIT